MSIDLQAPTRPARKAFYTVHQIAERHPAFTLRTLRYWIFNSKDRMAWKDGRRTLIPGNGFAQAIVRMGRRVYIDEAALLDWLEKAQRSGRHCHSNEKAGPPTGLVKGAVP